MKKSAKTFIDYIERNVDAFYADQIDSAAFGERQRAIWDEIENAGPRIKEAVVRHLREQLPPAHQALKRRPARYRVEAPGQAMTRRRSTMSKKTSSKGSKTSTKPATKTEPKAQAKKATAGNGKPVPKRAPEKQAAAPDTAASSPPKGAAKATKAVRARDPRLPEPGTVLQKKDRKGEVRCECTVEENGIRYQGTLYRSLSAAAMAASKDLGKGKGAQNGYLFWGIIKQPARVGDPVAALEKAWARYEPHAKLLLEPDLDGALRAKLVDTIRRHLRNMDALQAEGE